MKELWKGIAIVGIWVSTAYMVSNVTTNWAVLFCTFGATWATFFAAGHGEVGDLKI